MRYDDDKANDADDDDDTDDTDNDDTRNDNTHDDDADKEAHDNNAADAAKSSGKTKRKLLMQLLFNATAMVIPLS